MAQLILDKVTKTFAGNVLALEDLSLEAQDRELVVVLGPSGCGKSTTLRLIAGLEQITRGTIWIGNDDVSRRSPQDRDVAMVFQDYALYPQMTVFGNLAFGLRLRRRTLGLTSNEIGHRVLSVAKTLQLEHLLQRYPRQLSGGERQRVALGRAVVREPKVFLLDEPLTGLDPPLRIELRREIMRLRERGAAPIVYVTHDQADAMFLGDRIVVLRNGRVQQIGTRHDLYERPVNRFVAGFVGTPPMNFLSGSIVLNDGAVWFEMSSGRLSVPSVLGLGEWAGRELVLGFRPEATGCRARSERSDRSVLVGIVENSETMAGGRTVWVRLVEQSIGCRAESTERLEAGDAVELVFDMIQCHVFDTTGRRVALGIEKSSPGG
jgi:multiple sugar transport system ATP-binding protein